MKKALQNASGTLTRCLMVALLTLVGISASAADWKTLEIGTEYSIGFLQDAYYEYTATADGVVTLVSSTNYSMGGITIATEKADKAAQVTDIGSFAYSSYTAADGKTYSQRKQFSVTTGTTYYLYVSGPFSSGQSFIAYLDASVTGMSIKSSNYTENETFDISDTRYGQLTITFNLPADADDEATLTVPSKGLSAQIETHKGNSGSLSFILKDTLDLWLTEGKIVGGEEMKIKITGIKSKTDDNIKYGTDGTLEMTFLCPAAGHRLVESYIPSTFKSYWVKGNQEGIVRLTFDYDVAPIGQQTAVAVWRLGDANSGDIYVEQFDPVEDGAITIDGKNLYIDFTGVQRTYESMALKSHWSNVTLTINNVKMADGTNAYSSGKGTSGSYTFSASFQEVNSNINYEWTPVDGSDITEMDNIKLYLSAKDDLTFTGVKFYYQDTETDQHYQTIVTEGITSVDEEENGIEYTIPLTDAIKKAKNVRVSLDGVVTIDGNAHDEIAVKYNPGPELVDDFDPTAVSPADNSTVKSLSNITLTFDEDVKLNQPSGVKQIIFTDVTTGKNVPATIAVSESNSKQVVITPGETLKNTHKYQAAIGHAVLSNAQYVETSGKYGRFMKELDLNYTIYSSTKSYDFDMDPLEGSTLNEISSIKITTKAGKNSSTSGITSTSNPNKSIWIEKNGEKVATAKIEDIISESADQPSGFYINFSPAITEAGDYEVVLEDSTYYVGEGNNAEPNGAAVRISYTVIAAPTASLEPTEVSPASESTVESLKTITLTFNQDIYGSETPITALNPTTRVSVTGVIAPSVENSKQAIITLDEEITTEGSWTVTVPERVLGDKTYDESDYMTGVVNKQLLLYYTIGKETSDVNVVADPANGSTVESLKTIKITFPDQTYANAGYDTDIIGTVKDAQGNTLQEFNCYKLDFDLDSYNTLILTIDEITTAGTYTINFPAGIITFGEYGNENSPAFSLTYTVSGTDGINGIAADAQGKQTIYTLGGQKVSKPQRGIYIVNGKKVVVK